MIQRDLTWAFFKKVKDHQGLDIRYIDFETHYWMFMASDLVTYEVVLFANTPEAATFESGYKDSATSLI